VLREYLVEFGLIEKGEDSNDDSVVVVQWQYMLDKSCLRIIEYLKPKNIFIPKNDRIKLNDLLAKKSTNRAPEIAFF
jgi:hypothetical protein